MKLFGRQIIKLLKDIFIFFRNKMYVRCINIIEFFKIEYKNIINAGLWSVLVTFFCVLPTVIRFLFLYLYNVEIDMNSFLNRGEFYIYSASLISSAYLIIKDDDNLRMIGWLDYSSFLLMLCLAILSSLIVPTEIFSANVLHYYNENSDTVNSIGLNAKVLKISSLALFSLAIMFIFCIRFKILSYKHKLKNANVKDAENKSISRLDKKIQQNQDSKNRNVEQDNEIAGEDVSLDTVNLHLLDDLYLEEDEEIDELVNEKLQSKHNV